MTTTLEIIRNILVSKYSLPGESIKPDSTLESLKLDSLDLVELIMSIEEEFSGDGTEMEISDEDAEKIRTVQDAAAYIDERTT